MSDKLLRLAALVAALVAVILVTSLVSAKILQGIDPRVEHIKPRTPGSHLKTNENVTYFQVPLDASNHYHLFWIPDYKLGILTAEVKIVANHKLDWFAIGFSDYGEISDADLCILWYDRKGKSHFQDAYTDSDGVVHVDRHSDDCDLVEVKRKGAIIRLGFQRRFKTCDPRDYVIEDGTTHVVWASGPGPLLRPDDLNLKKIKLRGFQRVELLKNTNPSPVLPEDTRVIDILNGNVSVPADETTYWCSLHLLPEELQSKKHHVIQYEAVIQKGNEALVHHMEVFHCEVPTDQQLPAYSGVCTSPGKPPALEACKRVVAAWAMGAGPLHYPKETGLPIGGQNYSRYVMLEMHYNNPQKRSTWLDHSGMRILYTPTLRQYDTGILEIGLEYTDKNSIPPIQSDFDLAGYCTAGCTRAALPPEGITIFASQLHTHLTGIRVWTRHIREAAELPLLNQDNHYSQHFQEIRLLKQPVHLLPGDALINMCRYRTTARHNVTLGGYAISEEMCVNYMHYYPKTDLEVCKSSIDTRSLSAFFRHLHDYEGDETDSLANKGVSDNYQAIRWTPAKVELLKKFYDESPLSMQCNRSSGERFPGFWNGEPVTQILYPLNNTQSQAAGSECISPEPTYSQDMDAQELNGIIV